MKKLKNNVSLEATPTSGTHVVNIDYVEKMISKINVKDAIKVDSLPTYSNGTITYIKDGTTFTTTNSNIWFYYVVNGALKQTIFIEGEELTIDGASVNFDDYVAKTDIATTLDSTCTDKQAASAKATKTELDKKLNKSTVIELGALGNGTRGLIQTWHLDGMGEYISLDLIDKDGKIRRLQFNNGDSLKWLELYNYDGTAWGRIGNINYTNIDDVKTTRITPTFPSTMSVANNSILYSVKNGWANVEVAINIGSASSTTKWETIASGLPKPDKELNMSVPGENATGVVVGYIINQNGDLLLYTSEVITTGDWWNINFSYPVAE